MLIRTTRRKLVIASALTISLLMVCRQKLQAQSNNVLFNFDYSNGWGPQALITIDAAGNLYSTTQQGGNGSCENGCGTVFKLKLSGSSWVFQELHDFTGTNGDGATPSLSGVIFGPDGALYGTTALGGASGSYGTVFKLTPPPTVCRSICSWNETVLYRFQGGSDGAQPYGNLIFDAAGNLYGTTRIGGAGYCQAHGCGTAYKLTPSSNGWLKTILYNFDAENDGFWPLDGLVFDRAGNLYGTASTGGTGTCGTVYKLAPSAQGWAETVLYDFGCGSDGGGPSATPILDSDGNLYGDTPLAGSCNGGTAYDLTFSNGSWQFSLLATFCGYVSGGPVGPLFMDDTGSLWGTASADGGTDFGEIFKLTHSATGWTQNDLYIFNNGNGGGFPDGGLTPDGHGGFYGTTAAGGTGSGCNVYGCGLVFDFVP